MRRAAIILAVLLSCAGVARAQEPDLDALRRQSSASEDQRFRRTIDLADLYTRLERLEEARKLYQEALALRPDNDDVMENLLGVLQQLGDYAAQLPLCERLSATRPGDAKLQLAAGECLWRLKRTEEARRAWRDVLRRFPADRTNYDDLVDFYAAEGRPDDARAVLVERRTRFGEDSDALLAEIRLALSDGKPALAVPMLLRCVETDLSDDESRRAEVLLLMTARETGRSAEVAQKLVADLADTDAKLVARLMVLARQAADAGSFAQAASLADRALPLLKDAAQRAETSSLIATWRTKTK